MNGLDKLLGISPWRSPGCSFLYIHGGRCMTSWVEKKENMGFWCKGFCWQEFEQELMQSCLLRQIRFLEFQSKLKTESWSLRKLSWENLWRDPRLSPAWILLRILNMLELKEKWKRMWYDAGIWGVNMVYLLMLMLRPWLNVINFHVSNCCILYQAFLVAW